MTTSIQPPKIVSGRETTSIEIDALDIGGGLRRRPMMYVAAGVISGFVALAWAQPGMLWISALCIAAGVVATARPAGKPETQLSYVGDIATTGAVVAALGIPAESGAILWAGSVVSAYFSLDRRSGHRVAGAAFGTYVALAAADGRLAVVDLSAGHLRATATIAIGLGFAYVALVVPFIAQMMRDSIHASAELAEIRSRQAEFRASIASTVSHELRTPIAGIQGFVEILADQNDTLTAAERAEFLEIVSSQAVSLNAIIEDVLVAMRDEQGQLGVDRVRFDVSETAAKTIREMGPEVSAQVVVDPGIGVTAQGDPLRVSQVLRNLVTNAVKYGGDRIEVSVAACENGARVTVADDGAPIPPEAVAGIFEPFERLGRSSNGYGLGLPISRRLAQAMGGDLVYRSHPTKSFVLTLTDAPDSRPRDLGFGGAVGGA